MPNYKNGKIYCIKSDQIDKIYIGSTIRPLRKRFYGHKKNIGTTRGTRADVILKYDDCYIELIKEFPCDSKEQLLEEEGKTIRSTENCINCVMQFASKKEYNKHYRSLHKDELNERCKKYYKINRERIQKYEKEYIICECGFKVQRASISRHKRTERHKNLLEGKPITKSKMFLCDCGCTVSRKSKARHLRSKKHKRIIELI